MTIHNYSITYQKHLTDMMVPYMAELNCDVPEEIIRTKLEAFIRQQWGAGILHIAMAFDQQNPIGFTIYQIDSPASDWCKRPGWGFIREFYVIPAYRKQGIGKSLAAHTEADLRAMGTERLYLTSDQAIPFWQRCGWRLTGEPSSNDQYILEK